MSKIYRAIHKEYGLVFHFANSVNLHSFLFSRGASYWDTDFFEYSKKQELVDALNESTRIAWVKGSSTKMARREKVQRELNKES